MNIAVQHPNDAMHIIFFKLILYFDEFQPGGSMYHYGLIDVSTAENDERRKAAAAINALFTNNIEGQLRATFLKVSESGDPAIFMSYSIDENGWGNVTMCFPKMTGKPHLNICARAQGVAVAGDEASYNLRCGNVGKEKPEEKEAFEFLIGKLNEIISECTGN
jgi:hypothetical protein